MKELEKRESPLSIPPEWRERFLIKRIKEEDIEITLEQRNTILECLNRGDQFIQIGKYTLMLNSIKSIDPYYEPDNIPPCPPQEKKVVIESGSAQIEYIDTPLRKKWIELFGKRLLESNDKS